MWNRTAAVVVGLAFGGLLCTLTAQDQRTVWDGVYTDAQANRGAVLFDKECAQCHGPSGEGGGMAPALVGSGFASNYDGQTVADLFDRNRTTMPVGKEGQLGGAQNADVTAFILQFNKFPSGVTELPNQSMLLRQIKYVAER
jgi:mono/diheme cytochrome c family protein